MPSDDASVAAEDPWPTQVGTKGREHVKEGLNSKYATSMKAWNKVASFMTEIAKRKSHEVAEQDGYFGSAELL